MKSQHLVDIHEQSGNVKFDAALNAYVKWAEVRKILIKLAVSYLPSHVTF